MSHPSGNDLFLNPKPIYLRPRTAPEVRQYHDALQAIAKQQKGLFIDGITMDIIEKGIVAAAQDVVIAAQHYPEALETLIFGISFGFQYSDDDATSVPEDSWKGHALFARWFQKLSGLPNMIFFLNDHDARFYALAGDMLADEAIPAKPALRGRDGELVFTFPPPLAQRLANRLHNAGYFMHLFCHGTGIDPEPYIHALLADYDFTGLKYEGIRRQYEDEVRKGVQLHTGPL